MRICFVAVLISSSFAASASAGGSSYATTIKAMGKIEDTYYRLTVETVAFSATPERAVLHLKFWPRALGWLQRPSMITREAYDQCIAEFKVRFEKRESFPLGIMGTGFIDVPNKSREYQSNALAALEEYHGDRVCYSFAKPI
ncbi:MAG: hypothetical protein IGQ88_00695 [Gloeomargaritaceae cyanobacterium C42_A2020_066]|nr:hypothetical protein [Gloeomargaritaceae cyanobacterium C42_A2020_066]